MYGFRLIALLLIALITTSTSSAYAVCMNPRDSQLDKQILVYKDSFTNLQAAIDRFGNVVRDTGNEDDIMTTVNDLLDSLYGYNKSLKVMSSELQKLHDEWTKKRDSVTERAKDNPSLQLLAAAWEEKVECVVEQRNDILDKAIDTESLINSIEIKKESIIELYKLGMIDWVQREMQVIYDEVLYTFGPLPIPPIIEPVQFDSLGS